MSGRGRWGCALAATVALAVPREADACGGTFCDAGPTQMPVEQTGETILFVLDDGFVEAHIQIQYDPMTEADRFAWVIPVMALPEFSVGSQPLFDTMLAGTVPTHGSSSWREPCETESDDDARCTDAVGEDGDGVLLDVGAGEQEPDVVDHRTVGAFEITVLDGGTAESVSTWLEANGFQLDDDATPILGEYLAKDFMFVAVQLATDAEAADVHPIVLRIPGDEACVPITLTRIAAQDDLRLRVLFLARNRVVPDNYAHVVLNDVRLDWINRAANYDALVTQAVDGAGSRAWVTEYAGASNIVDTSTLVGEGWDAQAFVGLDPTTAVALVLAQGFRACDQPGCAWTHPLVESILREFLVPPPYVEPDLFFDCPACDPAALAASVFYDEAFADALQVRVIDPALHAEELFGIWPYLTRMYTTMSPEEMILDPTFVENPDARTASTREHVGLAASWCDGKQVFRLPDARLVAIDDPTVWPTFPGMSAYDRIERFSASGAPVVVEDLRVKIDQGLAAWNEQNGGVREPPFAAPCGGVDDGVGFDAVGFDAPFDPREPERERGCSCRTRTPTVPSSLLVALFALLGVRRRVARTRALRCRRRGGTLRPRVEAGAASVVSRPG